jgi:hypothetical protein
VTTASIVAFATIALVLAGALLAINLDLTVS